jgi:hypothetical protein
MSKRCQLNIIVKEAHKEALRAIATRYDMTVAAILILLIDNAEAIVGALKGGSDDSNSK